MTRWWMLGWVLLLASCAKHESDGLYATLEHVEPKDSTFYASLPAAPVDAALIPVQEGPPALVASRVALLTGYPCTNCHTNPLNQMKSKEARRAHWNIAIDHAPQKTMACTTCHAEENLNVLRTVEGSEIEMDHSYQLCGQCHSPQYADWQGGAHGKRLGGWTPPRTVMMCVECHDPHKPALETRWPVIPSNLMDRLKPE